MYFVVITGYDDYLLFTTIHYYIYTWDISCRWAVRWWKSPVATLVHIHKIKNISHPTALLIQIQKGETRVFSGIRSGFWGRAHLYLHPVAIGAVSEQNIIKRMISPTYAHTYIPCILDCSAWIAPSCHRRRGRLCREISTDCVDRIAVQGGGAHYRWYPQDIQHFGDTDGNTPGSLNSNLFQLIQRITILPSVFDEFTKRYSRTVRSDWRKLAV